MPDERWRSYKLAVFYPMAWVGADVGPPGQCPRVCTGREPLGTLPWELVVEVGREKEEVEEERNGGVGKESPSSCLGYFQISMHLHMLFPGSSCSPQSHLLPHFCLVCLAKPWSSFRSPLCWRNALSIPLPAVTDPLSAPPPAPCMDVRN